MINKCARDKLADRLRNDIFRMLIRTRRLRMKTVERSEKRSKTESSYAVMKNASDANNIITPNYVDCLDLLLLFVVQRNACIKSK